MRLIALLMLVVALSGCAYERFYRPVPGATPETIARLRAAPPSENILVDHVAALDKSVIENYERHGYLPIGYSAFTCGDCANVSESSAISQGKTVKADLVVIADPKYAGQETTVLPVTTQTRSTINYNGITNSTGSGTIYGSRGSANFFGSGTASTFGTATTTGTKTDFVPMTIHYSSHAAVYFIKHRFVFGALFRELNDSERQSLQTNKGVVVTLVVNDTPAFNADILVGDIITELNGKAVTAADMKEEALEANAGQTVTLSVLRDQKRLEISVQLPPPPRSDAVQGSNAAVLRK